MSFDLNEIPVIDTAGRLGRSPAEDSAIADAYRSIRPPLVGMAGAAGLALGLQGLHLLQRKAFPSPRDIIAFGHAGAAPSYTTYSDCTVFAGYGGTCEEPCFGFADHHMDPFYCATCAEQAADPSHNPAYFWHFTGSRGSIQYKDNPYQPCNGRDAWKWTVGACGECRESAIFRCHDGYKKYPDNTSWDPTICEGLISCDGKLKTC